MSSYNKNKNFGLIGLLEGTTESESDLIDKARKEVMKKLGVTSWNQPSVQEADDQEDLYHVPTIEKPVEVRNKFGDTPAMKEKAINDYLTRPPATDAEKEALHFWKGFNDPTGKKMTSHLKHMQNKYDGDPAKAAPAKTKPVFAPASVKTKPVNINLVKDVKNKFVYKSWFDEQKEYEENMKKIATKVADEKTVKQLTDLKNWSNNSKKV